MDEYLVHQTEKPLAQVASDHTDWQDRFYFNIHDRSGDFAVITGLGAFPNRNMVQAFMFAVHKGQHYSYFIVRPLNNDREEMHAGTLSFSIVEPMKKWRLEVADEANGIKASLDYEPRCPLYFFNPIYWHNGAKVVANQQHYTQAGRYTGSLTIGGETYTEGLHGIRDRSWGARAMADVPIWIWVSAQFKDFCISAWRWETPDGDPIHEDGAITYENGEVKPVTKIEHDLEIWPGTKRPKAARYRLTLASGEAVSLTSEEMGTMFLGPLNNTWPLSDPQALARADAAAFGFDQHSKFQMGGETGWGIVEYMMTGGSKRYGFPATKIGG